MNLYLIIVAAILTANVGWRLLLWIADAMFGPVKGKEA